MGRFRVMVATAGAMLIGTAASAQNSTVNGRVTDVRGGVIANADVTLRLMPAPGAPVVANMAGMNEQTARSGGDGTFTFNQVAAGQYVLQADRPGYGRASQAITVPGPNLTFTMALETLDVPGAEAPAAPAGEAVDTQALLDRIKVLEQRIGELESTTVLSDPETRVRRVEVFVDESGNQSDVPVPGATPQVTYQRERVYRRQTINEKIEEALADAEEHSVRVGVSAAITPQFANQNRGEPTEADGHAYQLASADLFFTAGIAQNTLFFADIVGLSGTPPDLEISGLTLINGFSARLERQNAINLREAWLRTEVFSQRLALVGGRVDLTNFFDRNAAANDETTQFLSDSLVNNPTLGLGFNGSGFAAVLDPKNGLTFKYGFQQSNPEATNLTDSLFQLAEAGYSLTLPRLGEGGYRAWYRRTNGADETSRAWGLSLDQKLAAPLTVFGRYGDGTVPTGDPSAFSIGQTFWSTGFQFSTGVVFNPQDAWGVGFSRTKLESGDRERVIEAYYNFQLSEKLGLSFNLTHSLQEPEGTERVGYFVPGMRFQASF